MNEYCYVDESIGTWCVVQKEFGLKERTSHCLAIVKDTEEFARVFDSINSETLKTKLRVKFLELVSLIEFGEVKISKTGIVKWHGGNFIKKND